MPEQEQEKERRHRTLTDEDIDLLAAKLEARILRNFYVNLGKGIWAFVWRGGIAVMLAIAAFGQFGGGKHP